MSPVLFAARFRTAAVLAAAIGCRVGSGVTKKTTMLVVGDQGLKRLAGHDKSTNHRKAEELIEQGIPIRILKESDFRERMTPHRGCVSSDGHENRGTLWLQPGAVFMPAVSQQFAEQWPTERHAILGQ